MNERIKELAEQATKRYPATESSGEFSTFDKEKFAELIIRRCAKVADLAQEHECEWIGGNILTQFGVKE